MAVYPGAVYVPTSWGGRTPRNKQGRGILHVAVSRARSLPPWNGNTWHMYVATDGYCEQYVDSDYRAYASGDANDDAFSIETAGGMGTSAALNAERWTPAQAERLADIMAWLNKVDGTPLDLLPDARPGRRGWGPHRLGIKHSAGTVPGWWFPGCESWSSVLGKECPGNAKVAQVPELVARARVIRDGEPDSDVQEDIDMRVIQSKGRGSAVVGPGYFNQLNDEALAVAIALYGKPYVGNDRQFDLARAIALQGQASDRVEKHLTPPAPPPAA